MPEREKQNELKPILSVADLLIIETPTHTLRHISTHTHKYIHIHTYIQLEF